MKKNIVSITMFLVILFSGCQQFTLLDELKLKSETENNETSEETSPQPSEDTSSQPTEELLPQLTFEVEKIRIKFEETIQLYPEGGTPPYSYYIEETELFYNGGLGSFSGNTYTSGRSVGKVNVVLEDSLGYVVKISLILRPPTPEGFNSSIIDDANIKIFWEYNDEPEMIDGFSLNRTDSSGNKIKIPVSKEALEYIDSDIDSAGAYTYSLQSNIDTLISVPTNTITVNMAEFIP